MRVAVSISAALVLSLGLAAAPAAVGDGKRKAPKTGLYGAVPELKPNQVSYQPGAWVVVKDGSKRVMVRDPQYSWIFWPEPGEGCNPYSVGLTAQTVAISKAGKFHVKEKIPISGIDDQVSVDWKGRWTKPTKLEGTVKISFKNCSEKLEWTGSREGPVPEGAGVPVAPRP